MSKNETGLTPLQADIKEAIEEHPTLEDIEIAEIVFNKRYPDEEYMGKDPSKTYVGKMRKRQAAKAKAPDFFIEEPEEPITYTAEEPETETEPEIEIPFHEAFEPPSEEELDPELEPEEFEPTIDGFTDDDAEFILTFTFDKIADWTGYDGWRFLTDKKGNLIDPNEIRFAGLTHRMMGKYMPEIMDEYFLEVMFCYTGIMIVGSKAAGYRDFRKRNEPLLKKLDKNTEPEPDPEPELEPKPEQEPEPEPKIESAISRLKKQRDRTR